MITSSRTGPPASSLPYVLQTANRWWWGWWWWLHTGAENPLARVTAEVYSSPHTWSEGWYIHSLRRQSAAMRRKLNASQRMQSISHQVNTKRMSQLNTRGSAQCRSSQFPVRVQEPDHGLASLVPPIYLDSYERIAGDDAFWEFFCT